MCIRDSVKGGAYGCGFRSAGTRQASFYTYRDPAIDPSLARIAEAAPACVFGGREAIEASDAGWNVIELMG